MFETQKIDIFFSGEKNLLDEEEKDYMIWRIKVVRFLKLFLPCLTALLCGVGIVLFDFDSDKDSTIVFASDEKIYFEKFRMKNTVFEITEKDNDMSTLKADMVEETEPGKKRYDLTAPRAKTFDGIKTITLAAKTGKYDQTQQVLDLLTDVVANYDEQMEIKTNSATYSFAKEAGYGNEKVIGNGENGYFEADKFTFDKGKGVVTLIHNVFIKNETTELRTPETASLFLNDNKFIATNATIKKDNEILKGNTVTALFKDTRSFEISYVYADGQSQITFEGKTAFADKSEYNETTGLVKLFGHVKVITDNGYTASADNGIYNAKTQIFTLIDNVQVKNESGYTAVAQKGIYNLSQNTFTLQDNVCITKDDNIIMAPKAIYFQDKDEFRFYEDVKIKQKNGIATAKSGVYYIKKNIAELEDDVVITKGGNIVHGDKAISDFNTSKSRLIAHSGGRISGKLIESTLKDKDN